VIRDWVRKCLLGLLNKKFENLCFGPNSTTRAPATDMLYNTTNGHHQRTSSQQFYNKFATSQCQSPTSRHVRMLGCGKFLSVGGEFVVQQVVELLWARPLVVSVAGVRVVEFGTLSCMIFWCRCLHCLSRGRTALTSVYKDHTSLFLTSMWVLIAVFFARDSICAKRTYAIAIPSVCPSIRLSHGWFMQKRLKIGSCSFRHTVAPSL